MRIGILALQGAVTPHLQKLQELGAEAVEVRTPEALELVQGLILPGGESTAMIHLAKLNSLWESLGAFCHQKPVWGICAGAILLAREVYAPTQESLDAIGIEAHRNAYGRQKESFVDRAVPTKDWDQKEDIEAVFIRAPRIRPIDADARVLFVRGEEPVVIEQGRVLVSTFHPELSEGLVLHRHFLDTCFDG